MTADQPPDAAVQALRESGWIIPDGGHAWSAVRALARAGWLHDPRRVAALEAVAEAFRPAYAGTLGGTDWWYRTLDALRALDAAPAGTTAEG
jgi:hypothetical protein